VPPGAEKWLRVVDRCLECLRGDSVVAPIWAVDEDSFLESGAGTHGDQVGGVDIAPMGLAAWSSLNTMATPAVRLPRPLVTLVRNRTVAKVDSIVISSPPLGVVCVDHQERVRNLLGGRDCLPSSITHIFSED
jgi:hypothetical protein